MNKVHSVINQSTQILTQNIVSIHQTPQKQDMYE
jgi:hypothetical protein